MSQHNGKSNRSPEENQKFWLTDRLNLHAEKQMEAIGKLTSRGYFVSPEVKKLMTPFLGMLGNTDQFKEVQSEQIKVITSDMQIIAQMAQYLSQPRTVARALGHERDGQARLRRYFPVGMRRAVRCTKHCTDKSMYTRGYTYAFQDDEGTPRVTNVFCEKCVRELGDPKQRSRLATLISVRTHRGKGRDDDRQVKVATEFVKTLDKTTTEQSSKPVTEDELSEAHPVTEVGARSAKELYEATHKRGLVAINPSKLNALTVVQLRNLCKAKGISPLPSIKADLISAIIG